MMMHLRILGFQTCVFLSVLLVSAFRFDQQIISRPQIEEYYFHARPAGTCKTETCMKTAKSFLNNMDTSVDPCDNFYKYACGNFKKHAIIRPDQTSNDSFTEVSLALEEQLKNLVSTPSKNEPSYAKNVRHFFFLCLNENAMDQRGVYPLLKRLEVAGGWPVLGNWKRQSWSILRTEILLNYLSINGNAFFRNGIEKDLTNNSRYLLVLDEPKLGLPRELLIQGEENAQVKVYYSFMVDVAVIFGANRRTAQQHFKEVLLMEIELAKITKPSEMKRDFFTMYEKRTLKQIMTDFSWFQWDKFLESWSKGYFSISESDKELITNVDYFKKLGGFLKKYPTRVLANYMMFRSVMSSSNLLTRKLRNRVFEFTAGLTGVAERSPRWKECLDFIQSKYSMAIASMYVKRFFDRKSKKLTYDLARQLRKEMRKEILNIDWMRESTRATALKKLDSMMEMVAYVDELIDTKKILEYYKDLKPNKGRFFEHVLDINVWEQDQQLKEFNKPVSRTDWRKSSLTTKINAFYIPTDNSIIIPAAFLQGSFFNAELPHYVNFATLGFVTGHEITHGFDDMGSQFNEEGNLLRWWDDESKKNFDDKKQCFIDQYGRFRDEQTNLMLNGMVTIGENIADNGGFKIAYKAYKTWASQRKSLEPSLPGMQRFTIDQLFLLSSANLWCSKSTPAAAAVAVLIGPHSPPEFRVNGVFMNFPEFGKIFQCGLNKPMNPLKKCAVW